MAQVLPFLKNQKNAESLKIVDFNSFLDFLDFFRNFLRVRVGGGPKLLSGGFFEISRVSGVLGSVDGRGDPNSRLQCNQNRVILCSCGRDFL